MTEVSQHSEHVAASILGSFSLAGELDLTKQNESAAHPDGLHKHMESLSCC